MRDVFPLVAGIANLVGGCMWGDPQREKGGILSIIIYYDHPPICFVTHVHTKVIKQKKKYLDARNYDNN